MTGLSRVVVLSSQSIFAEGIVAGLRQKLDERSLVIVAARQADPIQRILDARPSSVILDATDDVIAEHCPLEGLLNALPSLTVIRLDPQSDRIQVVMSEQHSGGQLSDLIDVIRGIASREGGA